MVMAILLTLLPSLNYWRIDMTRNEVKKLLPIIKAFSEGETIQHLDIINDKWEDVDEFVYHGSVKSYRIKPDSQSKYRPFKNAEECWKEMQKHQPFGWTYDYTNNIWDSIARVTSSGIIYEEDIMCFEDVFNRVKFADGSPFGVKIEEE